MKTIFLRQGSYVFLATFLVLSISLFSSCEVKETTPIIEQEEPPQTSNCKPAIPDSAEGNPDPYAKLAKGDWSFRGPYDWGSRVITIEMDPENPYRLYAGSASGGLWLNPDTRTQGWQWVNTNPHKVMGVKAIAIHPENTDLMYIGTGEVYNYDKSLGGYDVHKNRGSYGIGVLVSEDKGESWNKVSGLPDIERLGVIDIEITTGEFGTHVWAATTEGLYLSEDGKNFSSVLDKKMVTSISINPENHKDVVAAVGNLNIPLNEAGIYRTTDFGKNWKKALTRDSSMYMGKTELARAPNNPEKVYALIGTWGPLSFYNNVTDPKAKVKPGDCYWPNGAPSHNKNWLHVSENSGGDWTLVTDSLNLSESQGHYSMTVAVSPTNEEELLLGGISPIQRTENGGKLIQHVTTTGTSGLNDGCLLAAMGDFDVHQILYGAGESGLVYVCSDQGVYMSEDNLKSAHRINKNLAIMQFYPRMAFSDSTNILFGCAQDYGPGSLSYMGVDEESGRAHWELLYGYGHEAGYCLYDQKNQIGYMTIHLGNMIARRQMKPGAPAIDPPDIDAGNGAFYYIPQLSPFSNNPLCDAHTSWNTPVAFSPSKPEVIYAGKDIVYRSEIEPRDTAAGKVWTMPNPTGEGLDGNPIHQLIVAEDNHLELFTATSPRDKIMHVFHSLDGGISWEDITGPNLPKSRNPSYLTLDPIDRTNLYLTIEDFGAGRVWHGKNQDGSWTWTAIDDGLPNTFTRSITTDPAKLGHLYVATDYGVYKSTDFGKTWNQFSSGLPAAIEGIQLILYEEQRVLRLVSHGNGLWERAI